MKLRLELMQRGQELRASPRLLGEEQAALLARLRCQVARVVEVEPWSRIPERRYALIDYDL